MSDATVTTTPKPIIKVSTGPFDDVELQGHRSVEERDAEAGETGSTLRDADKSDAYRSTLPEIHEKFVKELETMSGMTRTVNADATEKAKKRSKTPDKVADVLENFVPFADRVKAALSTTDEGKATWASIDTAFRAVALATPIDASVSKRAGVSKDALEKAEQLINRTDAEWAALGKTMESTITGLLTAEPGYNLAYTDDGKPEAQSLARLINIWYAAQKKGL